MKCLYVMESCGMFKIGVSANPDLRLLHLRTGNPQIVLIFKSKELSNAYEVESALHRKYENHHVNGEWFAGICVDDLIGDAQLAVEQYGLAEKYDGQLGEKAADMLDWCLSPYKKRFVEIDAEIGAIEKENANLISKLIKCGWDYDEIGQLIEDATRTAGV